jgi:hypothetical protein
MKFIVSRTSLWKEEKPCEEAYKEGERWFVDIRNLKELLCFIDKHGKCIISKHIYNKEVMEIEIYNDYGE